MPYQILTLGQFLDQLAARLDDPTSAFFARDELLDYTKEALRTWGAFTGYWVRRAGFTPDPATRDYFLPSLVSYVPGPAPTLVYPLALSLTDQDLVNSLCYSLLEPPISVWSDPWPGTEQFDLPLLTVALEHSINLIQQETSLVTTVDSLVVSPTPINQYDLAADAITIRSAYWEAPDPLPATTTLQYPLTRQDQYVHGLVEDPALVPDSYSLIATAPRRIEVSPPPTDTATLRYVKVVANLALDPSTAPTVLYTPENFSWATKYHALFTLLNAEGERRDKFRADYCAQRVKDALTLSRIFPGILRCYINDVEVQVSTAWDMEASEPDWRNQLTTAYGDPSSVVLHSYSTISLHPLPSPSSTYSVTFDLSANAPIPALESDYLDLGSEHIQTLLDLAHHLACFKLGGSEFADSIPSYQRFLLAAMSYNKKLQAESGNFELLKEKTDFPRRRKPTHLDEEEQPDK